MLDLKRPMPGDEVMPPLAVDAEIQIVEVPDEQPLEKLGVYFIKDQYDEEHVIALVEDTWEAHDPCVLGDVVDICYSVLRNGLIESEQDAREYMGDLIEDALNSQETREYFGGRIEQLLSTNNDEREAALRGAPGQGSDIVNIAVASEVFSKALAELQANPKPAL